MTSDSTSDSLKQLFSPLLPGKKILLVVPPFWSLDMPCLGVHMLSACAKQAGFDADILYSNIHFASRIGIESYIDISCAMDMKMLGERVFARAAHELPLLGHNSSRMFCPDHVIGKDRAREFGNPYLVPPVKRSLTDKKVIQAAEIAETWTEEVARVLAGFNYQIIGFSSSYEQTNCSIALMKKIKQKAPGVITCIGGANSKHILAEGIASLDRDSAFIDYIFSGESEKSFPAFLRTIRDKRVMPARIIKGEHYKDLDELPRPVYDDYFNQLEAFLPGNNELKKTVLMPLESSRGCSWGEHRQCTFCGLVTEAGSTRVKSPQVVIDEIKSMSQAYGIKQFSTTDLLMPPSYMKTFVKDLADLKLDVHIMFEQKAGLRLEQLLSLKEAGILWILAGIESFSSSLLEKMNKGTRGGQNIRLLRHGAMAGLDINWNLLWGFPGDRKSQYQLILDLLPLIFHLKPPAAMMHLSLNRFSPYFENPDEYGISKPVPLSPYYDVFPPGSDINNLAYQFTGDYRCASHEEQELLAKIIEDVREWQEIWKAGTPPVLRINKLGDSFLLIDSREGNGKGTAGIINPLQAGIALTGRGREDKKLLDWALESRTGCMLEGEFVPLAVCDKQLFSDIEKL